MRTPGAASLRVTATISVRLPGDGAGLLGGSAVEDAFSRLVERAQPDVPFLLVAVCLAIVVASALSPWMRQPVSSARRTGGRS